MKRSWLYYLSPCILASVLCFCMMMLYGLELVTDKGDGKDWVAIFLTFFIPVVTVLLVVDYFIKRIVKGKVLFIWIIEMVLVTFFFLLVSRIGRISGC